MKKIMMLAAMLAMVFAAAAPAVAQDVSDDDGIDDDSTTVNDQYNTDIETGDINTQVCNNIVGDIDVDANQYNTGDNVGGIDGDTAQAISQEQGVSVEVVQQCFQALNTGTVVAGPVDDGGEVVHPEGVVHEGDDDDDHAVVYEDDSSDDDDSASSDDDDSASSDDSASASYSVLPDTGGASLIALGAGALLVAGGLVARRIVR